MVLRYKDCDMQFWKDRPPQNLSIRTVSSICVKRFSSSSSRTNVEEHHSCILLSSSFNVYAFFCFSREWKMRFTPSFVRSGTIAWKSSTAERTGSRAAWACPVKSCDCCVSPIYVCLCWPGSWKPYRHLRMDYFKWSTLRLILELRSTVALLAERDKCTTLVSCHLFTHWLVTCHKKTRPFKRHFHVLCFTERYCHVVSLVLNGHWH